MMRWPRSIDARKWPAFAVQLRIAPDGARTLLVRYTVKGSEVERQHRRKASASFEASAA
jgi:hypothetical protein